MIKLIDKDLYDFIKYIDTHYPQKQEVGVTVCHGYDCITVDEKGIIACDKTECSDVEIVSFAAFTVEYGEPIITLAGQIPENIDNPYFMHENFAHEYYHFMQYYNDDAISETEEDEAEQFAANIVAEYKAWKEEKKWR